MTWQQWIVLIAFGLEAFLVPFAIAKEPSGAQALARMIAFGLITALPMYAIYSTGFFN